VEVDAPVDWSRWYVSEEDDMGESGEQMSTNRLLQGIGENLARERGWNVFIGSDQFFQWVKAHPQVQVSPDFYLLDDPPDPAHPLPKSWQTWLPGIHPPRFAVEVVSDQPRTDHDDAPERYSSLGTSELVIFDPKGERRRPKRGVITLYRRSAEGAFVETYAGPGPAWSKELDCWLVVTGRGEKRRLRLARDARGDDLVPTTEELRAAADRRADLAERQVAKLKAQLARKEGEGRRKR
jgi:Uma2 family endonuclease